MNYEDWQVVPTLSLLLLVNTIEQKVLTKKIKSVGMTLAKVKEQDGMTLAKAKEQDGMTLAKVKTHPCEPHPAHQEVPNIPTAGTCHN